MMRKNLRFSRVLLWFALIALSLAACSGGNYGCQLSAQTNAGGKITNIQSGVSNNSQVSATNAPATQNLAANAKPENVKPENSKPDNAKPEYVPGEILVRFNDNISASWRTLEDAITGARQEAAKVNLPAELIERFLFINVYRMRVLENIAVEDAVNSLKRNPNVLYAEPNYVYWITAIPNDPRFDELWALHNTGQTGGTPDADIDAVEAWNIQTGSSSVVVAIIDTGVDYMHEDLAANMWTNSREIPDDDIDNDGNGYVDDIYGINAVSELMYESSDPNDDYGHGSGRYNRCGRQQRDRNRRCKL